MKKQRRGLNRYNMFRDRWNPWSAKQHHWKSEAKEDHQLSPGGPNNSLIFRYKKKSVSDKECLFSSRTNGIVYATLI